MVKLRRVKSNQSTTTLKLARALRETGLCNIFNPSFEYFESRWYVSFRATTKQNKKIESYLLSCNDILGERRLHNLTERYLSVNIASVSDPKIFNFNRELWLTFNTGWHPVQNKIYIARVAPRPGLPYECIYVERRAIEKNWAFYGSGDKLNAIYALNGKSVLQAKEVSHTKRQVEFASTGAVFGKFNINSFSIGSQLSQENGKSFLVAHKKIFFLKKRLYIGKLMRIEFEENNIHVTPSEDYLIHSFKSLAGSRKKHNENLISCSYFSGVRLSDNKIQLAYGVNDVSFGFAELEGENV